MNYYPYYTSPSFGSQGLFSSIGKNFSFNSFLDGMQRTLGIVNQAIPLIKEAAPVIKNAKTMFKVMNEFKKIDAPKDNSNDLEPAVLEKAADYNNGPTFFA